MGDTVKKKSNYTIVNSSEKIPDEYPYNNYEKGLVHIFANSRYKKNVDCITKTLQYLDYAIPPSHIHPINREKEFEFDLEKIATDDHENSQCLMIFFLGQSLNSHTILLEKETKSYKFTNIWSKFFTAKSFFDKPKIFIVQTIPLEQTLRADSMISKYNELPAEADICFIHNSPKDSTEDIFIEEFCENIKKYAERDDLFDIILRSKTKSFICPRILTTFTRKFYFVQNENRGYSYDIVNLIKKIKRLTTQMNISQMDTTEFYIPKTPHTLQANEKKEKGKSCSDLDKTLEKQGELTNNLVGNKKAGRSRSVSVTDFSSTETPMRPRLNSKSKKKPPIFKF